MTRHMLRVTDGTETVNLNDGGTTAYLMGSGYTPRPPQTSTQRVNADSQGDGDRLQYVTRRDVQETVHCALVSSISSIDAVLANLRKLERMFIRAEEWETRFEDKPVYAEFQPASLGDIYRS